MVYGGTSNSMIIAKFIDIIKSASGRIRVDSLIGYKDTYALDDLGNKDFVPKELLGTLIKTVITKTGADINTDGNIEVSVDSGRDLLAVYINDEPDFTQHFYSYTQNLVYGFDITTPADAVILIKFT